MGKFPREMGVFARICFVEVDRWTDVVLNQPDPIEFSLYCKIIPSSHHRPILVQTKTDFFLHEMISSEVRCIR